MLDTRTAKAVDYWRTGARPARRTSKSASFDPEIYEAVKAFAAYRRRPIGLVIGDLVAERLAALAMEQADGGPAHDQDRAA
jgi:hypothetical protein